jgi:DNA mismatch repair ATPase MutS
LAAGIGPQLRGWLGVVGEIEALAALASAATLNPDWTWPTVSADADALEAVALGHPLIAANRRVPNDVTVGPPGTVLIVTGSNMAGKSTLLRAIGLNAVLAQAGGPVCAGSLVVPNYPVWSSVRIQDSLEQGISLYMAELLRLNQIVDAAREGPILFLLDEILHGTNTSERRIAARSVIRQLMATRSIGTVSTHDLELIDATLEGAAECVHLVDQIVYGPDGPQMVFDYKLRPGLAPSSNALRLLELVGLGDGTPV